MRRIAFLSSVAFLVLSACGSDPAAPNDDSDGKGSGGQGSGGQSSGGTGTGGGVPHTCKPDGYLAPGEECDDLNSDDGDGCDAECWMEVGYVCIFTKDPRSDDGYGVSSCIPGCGNGSWAGPSTPDAVNAEGCDDGNNESGDGCDAHCQVESGYYCVQAFAVDEAEDGGKAVCAKAVCGDGLVVAKEVCDDGNTESGDGCSATCKREAGFSCAQSDLTAPSVCEFRCGDGSIDRDMGENCDDLNTVDGDGCSATCKLEAGFVCTSGNSTKCTEIVCGDGNTESDGFSVTETCDDGNTAPNDGCSSSCQVETTYACEGVPSVCNVITCGDGKTQSGIGVSEQCDDNNDEAGDGCSACQLDATYIWVDGKAVGEDCPNRDDFKVAPNAHLQNCYMVPNNPNDWNFSFADFSGADLRGADLSNVTWRYAKFVGANLTGARLFAADVQQANFSNANLTGANFTYAQIKGVNFTGADATNATFSNAAGALNADQEPNLSNTTCPDGTVSSVNCW